MTGAMHHCAFAGTNGCAKDGRTPLADNLPQGN